MNKREENFSDLTPGEFEQVMTDVMSPDFHDLAAADFFTALAAIEEEEPVETLELMAAVKNGQLAFLEPAPLHAHGNEIRLGARRVIINLVPEEVSNAA